MNVTIAAQQYRTIADIRGAVQSQKVKLLPAPNAEAIAYRQSLGLSQRSMSKRMGVSASLWQKIEAGERSVPETLRSMMRPM
jgi:DNA-binding transcriptional regulator YiaG